MCVYCRHYLRIGSSNRWLEVSSYTCKLLRLAKLIQLFQSFLRCQMKFSAGKAIQTTAQEKICAGKWACLARCEDWWRERQIVLKPDTNCKTYVKWLNKDRPTDVTCFIISLFTAQYVSNVSTSISRSLRLIVDLFRVLYCSGSMRVGVTVWFGWVGVVSLCRLKQCFII